MADNGSGHDAETLEKFNQAELDGRRQWLAVFGFVNVFRTAKLVFEKTAEEENVSIRQAAMTSKHLTKHRPPAHQPLIHAIHPLQHVGENGVLHQPPAHVGILRPLAREDEGGEHMIRAAHRL